MISCSKSSKEILSITCQTPIGNIVVTGCQEGIHTLHRLHDNEGKINPAIEPTLNKEKSEKFLTKNGGLYTDIDLSLDWLKSYFSKTPEESKKCKVPRFCFEEDKSTEFERSVWIALQKNFSFGKKAPYAHLAKLIGNPKASRAVGTALKKNPIMLIVPCHRVIRSDGKIGNFAGGGSSVKEWLLQHENSTALQEGEEKVEQ